MVHLLLQVDDMLESDKHGKVVGDNVEVLYN